MLSGLRAALCSTNLGFSSGDSSGHSMLVPLLEGHAQELLQGLVISSLTAAKAGKGAKAPTNGKTMQAPTNGKQQQQCPDDMVLMTAVRLVETTRMHGGRIDMKLAGQLASHASR